ncbi:MAG: acetate--CoA ligase [Gammaproteobacteria bacterium]|nr:acetate--CoA ligase [Gammaproteobacteria bacterium]
MSEVIQIKPEMDFHLSLEEYLKRYHDSIESPLKFWEEQAQHWLQWDETWTSVMSGSFQALPITWFKDGKLNVSANCLDRHLVRNSQKNAIIWQGNEPNEIEYITYEMLYHKTCQAANILKSLNVQRGDVVCIYMPLVPEAIYFMLACARIGAIHNVVFAGFASESLSQRIQDSEAKIILTADAYMRGYKKVELKSIVNEALTTCPSIEHVIVFNRLNDDIDWQEGRDIWYHELLKNVENHCPYEIMDSDSPLFILYTSGSTGKPKGILHTTGGYALYAAMTYYYLFNHQENSIHWCTADIGWITGHTYSVYGPLLNGATILLFEGIPNYPDFSRYWQIIDKFKVTSFYTAPTALRALRHEGNQWIKPYSLKSLRILGSVGEPINPEVWKWYFTEIGKEHCPIVNTWWQTESGGVLLSPFPSSSDFIPGSAGLPFFGILPAISAEGMLYIKNPWPGMLKTVYKNPERFKQAYFPNPELGYLTGDGAYQNEHGEIHITGRLDDMIKVSGHRLGTAELENALISYPDVSESAIIGIPHEIKGECIIAFIVSKTSTPPINQDIIKHLRETIGPIATPEKIYWVPGVPKTRSGKIMRRILKKITLNEDIGDTSSLANPEVISQLIDLLFKKNKQ